MKQKTFTGKSQTWLTKFWTQGHLEPACYLHTLAMDVIPRVSSFPWEGMSRDLWMTWNSFICPNPNFTCTLSSLYLGGSNFKRHQPCLQTEHSRNPSQCSKQTSRCSITVNMGRLVQMLNFEVQVLGLLCICAGCITCFNILFKRTFLSAFSRRNVHFTQCENS